MAQTDRQTDKTTRWSMTVYEDQWPLLEKMPIDIAEWGWQDEKCPDTGRLHKQGFFRTFRQFRFKGYGPTCKPAPTLCDLLPGIHIENAMDWNKLLNYCKKPETRVEGGEQVRRENTNVPIAMGDALTMLAEYAWTSAEIDDRLHNHNLASAPKEEYHNMVLRYLYATDNVNILGMLGNNIMVNNWINYGTYFKRRLAEKK